MTRVDFYILNQSGANERENFACRLAEKAYEKGMRVFILTTEHDQTARLDRLLWTFRQGSFVPHASAEDLDCEPVAIGTSSNGASELLINLTASTAPNWAENARVAEILDQRETTLQAGRQRYKEYHQNGCTPHTHHIEGRKL